MEKYTDRYIFDVMDKSARTRQYIIEKTAPVFNRQGFQGTSLTSLQEATGLTKGSLYGNFKDKEEIAREVFKYSMKVVREKAGEEIQRKNTAREKLIALFVFYAKYVFSPPVQGGCPLLNNAVEADDFHPALKKHVSQEVMKTISFIAKLIDMGKKKKEFRQDVKSMELAFVLFTSIEGAIMVSRISGSDASMKAVVKHCKKILDQISI